MHDCHKELGGSVSAENVFLRNIVTGTKLCDELCMTDIRIAVADFHRLMHRLLHALRYAEWIAVHGKIQFHVILIDVSAVLSDQNTVAKDRRLPSVFVAFGHCAQSTLRFR